MMNIIDLLKEKEMRVTAARMMLADILSDDPLSCEELYKIILEKNSAIDLASVYRNIDLFLRLGYAREVELGDGKKRYERTDVPHHHHLICKSCASIQDVEVKQNLAKEEERFVKEYQFQVTQHALEFYGLCKNCK